MLVILDTSHVSIEPYTLSGQLPFSEFRRHTSTAIFSCLGIENTASVDKLVVVVIVVLVAVVVVGLLVVVVAMVVVVAVRAHFL